MTGVPAHTNDKGRKVQSTKSTWYSQPYTTPNALVSTVRTDVSYKSPTQPGAYHGTYPYFRLATSYSRCVAKLTSNRSWSAQFVQPSGKVNPVWGEDSRHASGVSFGNLRFNEFSGVVSVSSHVYNRSITECLDKLADSKVNLAVAFAELRRTADFVAQKVILLVKIVKALRRGDFRGVWTLVRQQNIRPVDRPRVRNRQPKPYGLADAWLEYQYALKPLIADIVGGVQAIQRGLREKDLLFKVERTVTADLDPSTFVNVPSIGGKTTDGTASESSRCTIWAAVSSSAFATATSIGILNPLVVGWELIPFSFVIDWLIPVGTFLNSLTASVGLNFVDGHVAKLVKATVRTTVESPLGSSVGNFIGGSKPTATVEVFAFQRVHLTTFPSPVLFFKNPFSTSHVTSAVALVTQLRR